MNLEAAQALGLEALAFPAADERRLGALPAQAGWQLTDLRAQPNDREVIAGVLDFLLSDERLVLALCAVNGCAAETPMRARQALPGAARGD